MSETTPAIATGAKHERKWLAHFLNTNFTGTGSASWARLGKDLEDYSVEMNADIEQKTNILGEASVNVKGYKPQSSVEPYYAYEGDPLYTQLKAIINNRATGAQLRTQVVDAVVAYGASGAPASVVEAYREDVIIVPTSYGGSDGVQIPFEIYYNGNRAAVSGSISNGVFTFSDIT